MLYSACDFNKIFYTFPSSQFERINTFWLHVLYCVLLNFYYIVILSNGLCSLDLNLFLILRLARFITLRNFFFIVSLCIQLSTYDWCCNWDSINFLIFYFYLLLCCANISGSEKKNCFWKIRETLFALKELTWNRSQFLNIRTQMPGWQQRISQTDSRNRIKK